MTVLLQLVSVGFDGVERRGAALVTDEYFLFDRTHALLTDPLYGAPTTHRVVEVWTRGRAPVRGVMLARYTFDDLVHA